MLRAVTLLSSYSPLSAGCGQADLESGGNPAHKQHKARNDAQRGCWKLDPRISDDDEYGGSGVSGAQAAD